MAHLSQHVFNSSLFNISYNYNLVEEEHYCTCAQTNGLIITVNMKLLSLHSQYTLDKTK